jgi:hypothetical protein
MKLDEFYCHNPVLLLFYCEKEGLHIGTKKDILSHCLGCQCSNCLKLLENWGREIRERDGLALPK